MGVDVERIRPDRADEEIAERFFSPLEVAALRALPPHLRLDAFFNCWTRKEAYIKARGKGLTLPLDQFDVSLAPGEPAALLHTNGDPQEASGWSLQELAPGPSYVLLPWKAMIGGSRKPSRLERRRQGGPEGGMPSLYRGGLERYATTQFEKEHGRSRQ